MSRSNWQANEYMKTAKLTQADVARKNAAMKAHDEALRRYKWKQRLAMLGVCACWLAVGLFFAYSLYSNQS